MPTHSFDLVHTTPVSVRRHATLLTRLREHTAEQHRAVEATMSLDSLADRGRYGDVLARLYGFHAAFEAMLARSDVARLLDVAPYRKVPWLAADLHVLDRWPEAVRTVTRSRCVAWPRSIGALVGGLYVTEGATLGGQVIRKALLRMHATRPVPMTYFTGHGADTGRHWRDFCALAETLVIDDDEQVAACDYARDTFAEFGRCLAA